MHNDPRTDKNIIYTRLIQDLINNEGEMQWSSKATVERMNREFALGFITKLAMFRAGYSMQADGTMARSTGTGEEYTVHYVDENGNEATATSADDYYKVAKAYAKKLISLKDRQLNNNFKQILIMKSTAATQLMAMYCSRWVMFQTQVVTSVGVLA